ncbi:Ribonuclease HII [Bathymodiolus heckerae thiotrophic gill symbiont]|uniref:ribonuclease HII n=1 Tax=Bathymodiolus heckerae thiotrophic gill symbiont TaxID=1052212 RepID=UPI0010BA9EF2|nr:ribonuclease HII [Bathymodiolus heckerae thiotrophic gill symbiont]SHN93407.1 Ribonuclease HII [Bathymodiolus heckerae thiotrophic gill symbiont]
MIIVGVDEAGRGPLVGSVVAGAVILPTDFNLPELTDSKKLSEKKRNILYHLITDQCQWSVGEASAQEIDEINILQATMLAMQRAVESLNVKYDQVLVDGNRCPDLCNCTAIVKGDLTEPVISAASIIAKVTRDRQMIELDKKYPQYGFAKHKGYGTKVHLEALQQYGAIEGEHRFSFAPVNRVQMRG